MSEQVAHGGLFLIKLLGYVPASFLFDSVVMRFNAQQQKGEDDNNSKK